MLIDDVQMKTADLASAVGFYRDILELSVEFSGDSATVSVGRSTVTLVGGAPARESNHIAFTIPRNQFAAAKEWLAPRTELMSWADGEPNCA